MRNLALAGLALVLAAGCSASSDSGRHHQTRRPSSDRTAGSPTASTAVASAAASAPAGRAAATVGAVPRFAHVVVVVEENHASRQVIGSRSAPYMNYLARTGTLLTRSYAITHPSYPNYLALFSGSTHGITDDSCPHYYRTNNLAAQLRAKGLSFAGFAQSLPYAGYRGCTYGSYARRHAPWVDFTNVPRRLNKPMRAFPRDYATLPRVSFVIPNVDYDMHDGTVRQADDYLRRTLGGYVSWARKHNSLLLLTWDEDDKSAGNHIAGVLVGAHVKAGARYASRVDHYRMLRTIEAAYGLPALGHARQRTPITGIWVR